MKRTTVYCAALAAVLPGMAPGVSARTITAVDEVAVKTEAPTDSLTIGQRFRIRYRFTYADSLRPVVPEKLDPGTCRAMDVVWNEAVTNHTVERTADVTFIPLSVDSSIVPANHFVSSRPPATRSAHGANILCVPRGPDGMAAALGMSAGALADLVAQARATLFRERERRVKPGLDDKVLAGWNGLALAALAEAGRALGRQDYLDAAVRNAEFLTTAMMREGACCGRGATARRGSRATSRTMPWSGWDCSPPGRRLSTGGGSITRAGSRTRRCGCSETSRRRPSSTPATTRKRWWCVREISSTMPSPPGARWPSTGC